MDNENLDNERDETAGAGELGEDRSLAPRERERWLDVMADMQTQSDRRYESISRRIAAIERKAGGAIPDEMKGFLLMLGLYIGVQLLLPLVIQMVDEWVRSRSSRLS